jgi:hypothetical protein
MCASKDRLPQVSPFTQQTDSKNIIITLHSIPSGIRFASRSLSLILTSCWLSMLKYNSNCWLPCISLTDSNFDLIVGDTDSNRSHCVIILIVAEVNLKHKQTHIYFVNGLIPSVIRRDKSNVFNNKNNDAVMKLGQPKSLFSY